MSNRWDFIKLDQDDNADSGNSISLSENDSESEEDNVSVMPALTHTTHVTLKRRSTHSLDRNNSQKIRKVKEPKQAAIIAQDFSSIIRAPLGKSCCDNHCLVKITFEEAEQIFNEWNINNFHRLEKMKDYLKNKKQDHEVLYSHCIGGNFYILNYELNGANHYLCVKAFRKLVHMGQDKLQELATSNDCTRNQIRNIQVSKVLKKELVERYMDDIIVPQCVPDESYPSLFIRCEVYARVKDALLDYNIYLNAKYPANSINSYCSSSLFKFVISEKYSHILWGISTHCPTCALIKQEISKLKNEKKKLEHVPINDQRVINLDAYIQQYEEDLKHHNQIAKSLRNYSSQFAHRSKVSGWKEISWIFDYMAHKQLPQPKASERSNVFEIWRKSYGFGGMKRLTLRFAGLFDHHTNESYYTVHTHNTESANTILTILYLKLKDILSHSPQTLNLTMDNKKTGKCYLLLAFQELLVCHWQVLDCVRTVFLLKGIILSLFFRLILSSNY
jgi:thiol-disulfide isomerase/thioredoxin